MLNIGTLRFAKLLLTQCFFLDFLVLKIQGIVELVTIFNHI